MKFRSGFVSNSSTSSFVVITTKKVHEAIYAQLEEWEQKVVDKIMGSPEPLGGIEVVYGNVYTGSGGEGDLEWLEDDIELEDGCSVYEAWDKYRRLLKKNKKDVITFDAGDGG